MWMSRALSRLGLFRLALAGLALGLAAPALPAHAQGGTDSDLAAAVQAVYQVSPAPGGVLLRPREARYGVETVTVSDDRISVNGNRVDREVVAAWLGDDAAVVLRLAALSPAERRRLFGFDLRELGASPPGVTPTPDVAVETAPPSAPDASAPVTPPATPAPGETSSLRRTGSQFTLFNDLVVQANESAREAVSVFGSVTVLGEVREDTTAVFGSVFVEGKVAGNVVAVQGQVHLGPRSVVEKDVTSVGRGVEQAPGARVGGAVRDIPFTMVPWHSGSAMPWVLGGSWFHPLGGLWALFWRLTVLGALALFLGATYLVAPQVVERVAAEVTRSTLKAGIVGFLTLLLFVPAVLLLMIVLVITILGIALIPFLAIALPFLIIAVLLVGYGGISLAFGRWLASKLEWRWVSPYAHLLLGLLAFEGLRFAGGIGLAVGGLASGLGWLLLALGSLVRLVVLSIAIGGAVLVRYGRWSSGGTGDELAPPAPPVVAVPPPPAV